MELLNVATFKSDYVLSFNKHYISQNKETC